MNKLKWWLRVVGGWYLLLGVSGFVISFVNPNMYAADLPALYAGDKLAVAASMDMNFLVMLIFIVVAVMAFFAARDPQSARSFIWMMVCFEFFAYAVANVIWAFRGWENVLPFVVLHLLFGGTGALFLRQTQTK